MADYVTIAEAGEIAPGQGRTLRVNGHAVALYNLDGGFHAIADTCPHRGGPLGAGVLEDGLVHCPLHGWAFDVKTGACQTNPAKPVRCYPVRVENGRVQIRMDD
jgi:NAD(P)H-dependent nitrite reductase small subunit